MVFKVLFAYLCPMNVNSEISEVKTRVIGESLKLFLKYGVKSITMNDIAKSCGISKRTLYETFHDKDELLEICIKTMNGISSNERRSWERESTDVLDFFMKSVQRMAERSNQINPNFYREMHKFYPRIAAMQLDHIETTVLPETAALIQKGIEEGLFRPGLDTEMVSRLLVGQFDYVVNSNFAEKVTKPISEILKVIIQNFVRGIATEKGLRKIEAFEAG